MEQYQQLQEKIMSSVDKSLNSVSKANVTSAANLLLNRRDNLLESVHSDVTNDDLHKMRNAEFANELFPENLIAEVEKLFLDRSHLPRSPKRQKKDYQSRNYDSRRDYRSQQSYTQPRSQNQSQSQNQNQNQNFQGRKQNSFGPTMINQPEEIIHSPEAEVEASGGNDYMTETQGALLLPGGRLQQFWKVWLQNNVHPRVLQLIQEGYRLHFKLLPPLTRFCQIRSEYKNLFKQRILKESVLDMLRKQAIVPVRKCNTLGFYSRLFLVPKSLNKWRPVIDLSVVNKFLHVPTFKMETAESIRNSLRIGEWVVSIDLTDSYFHLPIHPISQKYLRFQFENQIYQFVALPFGLATAPLEFTRVVKEVKIVAMNRNLRIHQYLDDWLLRSSSESQCQIDSKELVSLVESLG